MGAVLDQSSPMMNLVLFIQKCATTSSTSEPQDECCRVCYHAIRYCTYIHTYIPQTEAKTRPQQNTMDYSLPCYLSYPLKTRPYNYRCILW